MGSLKLSSGRYKDFGKKNKVLIRYNLGEAWSIYLTLLQNIAHRIYGAIFSCLYPLSFVSNPIFVALENGRVLKIGGIIDVSFNRSGPFPIPRCVCVQELSMLMKILKPTASFLRPRECLHQLDRWTCLHWFAADQGPWKWIRLCKIFIVSLRRRHDLVKIHLSYSYSDHVCVSLVSWTRSLHNCKVHIS